MKYIGITGHRGSGKTSTAYLLGNILDCLRSGCSRESIKQVVGIKGLIQHPVRAQTLGLG